MNSVPPSKRPHCRVPCQLRGNGQQPVHHGFSLIEVLVSLALSTLLLSAVYSAISMYFHYSHAGQAEVMHLVTFQGREAADQEVENNSWAHLHYRDEFKRGLAAEAFLDGRKDDFQALDSRLQLGGGMRFTLNYEPDVRAVYAGIGALYEWEDQAGRDDDYWRLNAYFAYKRQLNEQVRGLFDITYQPSLSEGRDYLLKTELGVLVKLAEQLDLKLGVRYQYDGDAPSGIESDDTSYITAINFHF